MVNVTVQLDTAKFDQAVKFVFDNTRRTLPEILNRAALVTLIGGAGVEGAMKKTRRADAGDIKAVPKAAIAAYVRGKNRGSKLSRQGLAQLVKKEIKRRIAAIGYTAIVGWNAAVVDLGGHGGKGGGRSGKGFASMGYARPATHGHYEVTIANTTPAAEMIGAGPLQDALDETADDMIRFWEAKTGAIFRG